MDSKEDDLISIDPITCASPSYTISGLTSDSAYHIDYQALKNSIDLSTLSATGTVIGGNTAIQGAQGSNHIWTTTGTGTGGLNWNIASAPSTISAGGRMSLHGEKADVEINGKSMSEWMAKVEERLNILTPNPELEKEWDDLRRLGERYRKLEKKCKEKAEMWKQLKKMPAPRPPQV